MKKIGSWLSKHKNLLLCLLIGLFIGFYWWDIYNINVATAVGDGYMEEEITETGNKKKLPLNADKNTYEQSFVCKSSMLYGISIPLKITDSHEGDKISVKILDDAGQELAQKIWKLEDGEDIDGRIIFEHPQKQARNRKYTVRIKVIASNENSDVKLLAREAEKNSENLLLINGEASSYVLRLKQVVYTTEFVRKIAVILGISVMVVFVSVCFWAKKKVCLERICIPLILALTLLYSAVLTPLSIPDEVVHFYSAYEVSNKMMLKKTQKEGNILVRNEDAEISGLGRDVTRKSYFAAAMGLTHGEELEGNTWIKEENVAAASYFYLAAAVGISIGRLFHLSVAGVMYLGRFCNSVLFAVLAYLGLKRMPFAKDMYLIAALSPMVLHQSCSLSYDALILGLAFFFTGTALQLIYEKEKIAGKDMILPAILGMLLAPAKSGAYLPICFLLLLIPKEKFDTKRKYYLGIAGTLGAVVLAFGISFILHSAGLLQQTAAGNLNIQGGVVAPTYSIGDFFRMPKGTFAIFIRTFLQKGGEIFMTAFGSLMASCNLVMESVWVVAFLGILFLASLKTEGEKEQITIGQRIWIGLLVLGSVFLVALGMFIGWTPRGNDVIMGIQGRYFLPVLPLLLFLLRNDTLIWKKNHDRGLVIAATAVNLAMLIYAFGVSVIRI